MNDVYMKYETKYEIFLQRNNNSFFFRKFCFPYIFDLDKTV